MSDHLPPLADLLPHLHAGDHITAEFRRDAEPPFTISGTVKQFYVSDQLSIAGWPLSGEHSALTAITSAPDAHQRWAKAQQPTWADGTPADDDTVAVVAAENDYGQQRRYGRGADGWIALDGWEEGPDHIATATLVERGARPVARYIADQPAQPDRMPWAEEVARSGPISETGHRWPCIRFYLTSQESDPCSCDQPAPEPATCDRDHEPAEGSKVVATNGDEWERLADGCWSCGDGSHRSWWWLWTCYGPLTLVEDGTNTGAEQ